MTDDFLDYLLLSESDPAETPAAPSLTCPAPPPAGVSPELLKQARAQHPRLGEADLLRLIGLIRLFN